MKIICPECKKEIDMQIPVSSPGIQERTPVGKPGNFQIERSLYGLQIVRSWFNPSVIALSFFCLVWNGFMAFWFYIAFKQKAYIMALFGSLHGSVGLGLLYGVLAGFLNKTYINISNGVVSIKHKPLPWLGQKNIPRQELKQLYTTETIYQGKNGYSKTYSVKAITHRGQVIQLVSDLSAKEESLFIEQEVEKYLKIEDEPVTGEIPR